MRDDLQAALARVEALERRIREETRCAGSAGPGQSAPRYYGTYFEEGPLFCYGTAAQSWLFHPRGEGPPVLILDFSNGLAERASPADRAITDAAAFLLQEWLWVTSDARVAASLWLDPSAKKVGVPEVPLAHYPNFAPMIESLTQPHVIVWGALDDPGVYQVRVRLPGESSDVPLRGSLVEVRGALTELLVSRRAAGAFAAPPWYRWPTGERLADYARVLDGLAMQILADADDNAFLDPLPEEQHHQATIDALTHAVLLADGGANVRLAALVSAIYAGCAGALLRSMEIKAVDLVLSISDVSDPVYQMSPYLLDALGEVDRTWKRFDELALQAQGAYAGWLDRLLDEDEEDEEP